MHSLNSSSYNPISLSLSGSDFCTFSAGFHEISSSSEYIVCSTGEVGRADVVGLDVLKETVSHEKEDESDS